MGGRGTRLGRGRRLAAALVLALGCFPAGSTAAQESGVPIGLQATLLAKVAGYDRNLAARAGPRVRIAVVVKPDNTESKRAGMQLKAALDLVDAIGGLPHEEWVVEYTSADALVTMLRDRHVAIAYLGPAMGADIDALRAALDRTSILTVAGTADYVAKGVVLGFGLHEAKTKMFLNVEQARKQDVAFAADVLKLMRMYP